MKKYIMNFLFGAKSGDVTTLIFNAIQMAKYNSSSDKFEVSLKELNTNYFADNSNPKSGVIENTPIHWDVSWGNLNIWLE